VPSTNENLTNENINIAMLLQTFNVDTELLNQEESLLFVFQQTISAQYLRFIPDLSSFSSTYVACVKLEFFGHPEPQQPIVRKLYLFMLYNHP